MYENSDVEKDKRKMFLKFLYKPWTKGETSSNQSSLSDLVLMEYSLTKYSMLFSKFFSSGM